MSWATVSRLAAVSGIAVSLSACATVTRGQNDAWEVITDPVGARVETTNGHQCPSTPCAIRMSRKSEFTATITKEGYKTATVSVTHRTAGAGAAGMAGNVLVGGIIGIGVDAVTGASQDLTPNPAIVKLEPIDRAEAPAPTRAAAAPAIASTALAAPAAPNCGLRSVTSPNVLSC